MLLLGGEGCWEGLRPDHNFRSKKVPLFVFLLPFDREAFKTCKNTIKTYWFVWSTLSWVGSLVDSEGVLWLVLIEVGEGERVKISLSNLFNYFSVSPLCGGHHSKVPLFLTPPLKSHLNINTICRYYCRNRYGLKSWPESWRRNEWGWWWVPDSFESGRLENYLDKERRNDRGVWKWKQEEKQEEQEKQKEEK